MVGHVMPLQKRAIPINIAEGLDTKTDSKHVLPGKLTVLENGVYRKNRRIDKIPGYSEIENKDISGNTLGNGSSLSTFNDELLQYNDQKVYSYSRGASAWVDKGEAISVIAKSRQIVKNTAAQTQADSAITNGVGVYAWEDSRGGVRASVIDETTGANLISDTELDATATRVRCLAFNGYLFVFYYKSGSLYVRRVNPQVPTEFDAAVEVSSTVNTTNPNYDVYAYQNLRMLFAHNVQGASEIKAGWLNEVPEVLTGILAPVTISDSATKCLGIVPGPTQTFYIGYHNGSDIRCTILNNGLGELYAPFTIETIADGVNLTGYMHSNGVQFLYEVQAASTYNTLVKEAKVNDDGTAETPTVFKRSVGLYSKAFRYTDADGNTSDYVAVTHDSTLQATYFVCRADGLIIAKQQYTNAGGLTSRPILANVNQYSDTLFTYAILNKNRIVSENATIFTPLGVMRTSIDFSNANIFTAKQLGNNLLIVGGVLSMYDSESVVEHGFHLYPENETVTPVGSGGSLADGTYAVYLVYEWTDQFGQIHRSQPSVANVVSVSGGSNGSIDVTAPSLRLTRKDGTNRTNIAIVGYVTEADGTIPYRFTSVSSPIYNDVTVDTVSLGTITDVSASNEILYTTGGVLPNTPAPACSVIEVFKNRVWLSGLEEANQAVYSKENKKGEPVEFTTEFNKSLESAGGDVVGLGVIDDKILAFKRDRFYFTYGDGPNNTDTLGAFAEFEFSNSDIGLDNPMSIANLPSGIALKTQKGFYHIDSSLNPIYVGADVEAFNGLSVTSAVLLAGSNEVRFTNSDGDMLVFNYFYNRWSTSTNREALSGVLFGIAHVILRTDGTILEESTDTFKDGLNSYQMRFVSGWISLTGVNSFKRIYELMVIGQYVSKHKFRIKIGYDYSDGWEHEGIYDPDTNFPVEVYGQSSPYGESGSLYGGAANGYLVRVKMKRQKCAAFRFCLEELVTTATEGTQESFSFSDIGILVGLKRGQAKVSKGRTMGVN